MDVSASHNATLTHVNQFWSMLDEMAQNNPDEYKSFIERQMRDSGEYFSPPEPHSCLRTSVQVNHSDLHLQLCKATSHSVSQHIYHFMVISLWLVCDKFMIGITHIYNPFLILACILNLIFLNQSVDLKVHKVEKPLN